MKKNFKTKKTKKLSFFFLFDVSHELSFFLNSKRIFIIHNMFLYKISILFH
jgi:hypothetical protein